MMMRRAIPIALALTAFLLVVSCASTPPQPPAPLPEAELAQAKQLKEKADRYSLGPLAQAEYTAAEADLKAGEAAYGTDNAASKVSLDKAIAGYQSVLDKAGPLYLGTIHDRAAAARKSADDLKASVAVKDDYAKALAVYDRAVAAKTAGDLEAATKDFEDARVQFEAVAKVAKEKRDKALAAGADVDKALEESAAKAAEAQAALEAEGLGGNGE
jgi:hypothetical protein